VFSQKNNSESRSTVSGKKLDSRVTVFTKGIPSGEPWHGYSLFFSVIHKKRKDLTRRSFLFFVNLKDLKVNPEGKLNMLISALLYNDIGD